MPEVEPSSLCNAFMGKLYDVLCGGDEGVPPSTDNFLTWASPGIPVEPADFQFLVQGLTGVVKPKAVAELSGTGSVPATPGGAPPATTPELTPAVLEQLRAQDAAKLYMQAENLARLLDFIPDVTKVENDQFARLNILNNEGTLSDVYEMVLRMSQVMKSELKPEVQARLEEFRKILSPQMKKEKDLFTGEEVEVPAGPSKLETAYFAGMAAYDAAALEYNSKRIDALTAENQKAVHDFAINANIYRNKVKAARAAWEASGYKTQYEQMAAFMEQVQARDLSLLKAEYKDAIEKARLTGLASGSDFLFHALVPGSFATSNGWTGFTFNSFDYESRKTTNFAKSQNRTSGGGSFFGIFGGRGGHSASAQTSEYHGKFDSDSFSLSFEICQVPIVRPWFKRAFLNSKSWRFDENSPDVKGKQLSDGGSPPTGLMPAYPTACIFIRNLQMKFKHSQGFSDYIETQKQSATSGGGVLSFGPIALGGTHSRSSASGSTDRNLGYSMNSEGMTVPGMQLIGFKCHVMPKSPDPLSTITSWV